MEMKKKEQEINLNLTELITKEEEGIAAFKLDVDIPTQQYLELLSKYLTQKQKYKITRKEISKKSKLSYNSIYKIDTCQEIPQIITLLKLFDAVDCVVEFKITDKRNLIKNCE